jgi:hypothetical protein
MNTLVLDGDQIQIEAVVTFLLILGVCTFVFEGLLTVNTIPDSNSYVYSVHLLHYQNEDLVLVNWSYRSPNYVNC